MTSLPAATSLAQNRIDYIVYHKTTEVSDLLYKEGFQPPKDPVHLSQAIKELVREKGTSFLKKLIRLHPDTKAIIYTQERSYCTSCQEDSFTDQNHQCSACGSKRYSDQNKQDFIDKIKTLDVKTLEKLIQRLKEKSQQYPNDIALSEQLILANTQLASLKENTPVEKETQRSSIKGVTMEDLQLLGIVFIAGILIGGGLNFRSSYGK